MPLPTILLILAAISIGATVIAAIVAIRSTREARSAIFPIVKEEEAVKAQRARISIFVWLSITALLLGGWLAALRFASPSDASPDTVAEASPVAETVTSGSTQPAVDAPSPSPVSMAETDPLTQTTTGPAVGDSSPASTATTRLPANSPTPEPSPDTPTPAPSPTATPSPTPTPLPPTATATSTPTPVPPTATPTSLADVARIPTSPPRTPAPPEVDIGPIRFAEGVTDDFEPVNPDRTFSTDVERVYAIYPFSGMEKGLDFAAIWYHNGVELAREETEWQYGEEATSFNFLRLRGPGLYKLELYVNDSIVATNLFEVEPADDDQS